ncbi:hypothetical protein BVX93_01320, partial [bacterium B13(2017)]
MVYSGSLAMEIFENGFRGMDEEHPEGKAYEFYRHDIVYDHKARMVKFTEDGIDTSQTNYNFTRIIGDVSDNGAILGGYDRNGNIMKYYETGKKLLKGRDQWQQYSLTKDHMNYQAGLLVSYSESGVGLDGESYIQTRSNISYFGDSMIAFDQMEERDGEISEFRREDIAYEGDNVISYYQSGMDADGNTYEMSRYGMEYDWETGNLLYSLEDGVRNGGNYHTEKTDMIYDEFGRILSYTERTTDGFEGEWIRPALIEGATETSEVFSGFENEFASGFVNSRIFGQGSWTEGMEGGTTIINYVHDIEYENETGFDLELGRITDQYMVDPETGEEVFGRQQQIYNEYNDPTYPKALTRRITITRKGPSVNELSDVEGTEVTWSNFIDSRRAHDQVSIRFIFDESGERVDLDGSETHTTYDVNKCAVIVENYVFRFREDGSKNYFEGSITENSDHLVLNDRVLRDKPQEVLIRNFDLDGEKDGEKDWTDGVVKHLTYDERRNIEISTESSFTIGTYISETDIADWEALLALVNGDPSLYSVRILIAALGISFVEQLKLLSSAEELTDEMKSQIVSALNQVKDDMEFFIRELPNLSGATNPETVEYFNELLAEGILIDNGDGTYSVKEPLNGDEREDMKRFHLAILKELVLPSILTRRITIGAGDGSQESDRVYTGEKVRNIVAYDSLGNEIHTIEYDFAIEGNTFDGERIFTSGREIFNNSFWFRKTPENSVIYEFVTDNDLSTGNKIFTQIKEEHNVFDDYDRVIFKTQNIRRMDANEGVQNDEYNNINNYSYVFVDYTETRYEHHDFFGNISLTDERHYKPLEGEDGLNAQGEVSLTELEWSYGSIVERTGFNIRGKWETEISSNYYVDDISAAESQKSIDEILDGPESDSITFDSFDIIINSNPDQDGNFTEQLVMTVDVYGMSTEDLKDITLDEIMGGAHMISKEDATGEPPASGLVISKLQKKFFSSIDNQGNVGRTDIIDYEIDLEHDGFIGGELAYNTDEIKETGGRVIISFDFTTNGQARNIRTMNYIIDENGHKLFQDATIEYKMYNADGFEIFSRTATATMEIDPNVLTTADTSAPEYYEPWGNFENFSFNVSGYREVTSRGIDSEGNAHWKETINCEALDGCDGVLGVSVGEVFKTESYTIDGETREVHYIAATINDEGLITSYYRIEYAVVEGVGLHLISKDKFVLTFDAAGNISSAQQITITSESEEFLMIYNAKIAGENYTNDELFGIMLGARNGEIPEGTIIPGLTPSEMQEFIEMYNLGIVSGDERYDELKSKIISQIDLRYNELKSEILESLNLTGMSDERFNELLGVAFDGTLEPGSDIIGLNETESAAFIDLHNRIAMGETLDPADEETYNNLKTQIISNIPFEERINDYVLGMLLGIEPGQAIPTINIPYIDNDNIFALIHNALNGDDDIYFDALVGAVNGTILEGTMIPGLDAAQSAEFIEKFNAGEIDDDLKSIIMEWANEEYNTALTQIAQGFDF